LPILGIVAYLAVVHFSVWLGRRADRLHLWVCAWLACSVAFVAARYFQRTSAGPDVVALVKAQFTAAILLAFLSLGMTEALVGRARSRRFYGSALLGVAGLAALNWATELFVVPETVLRTDALGAQFYGVRAGPLVPLVGAAFLGIFLYAVFRVRNAGVLDARERRLLKVGFLAALLLALSDMLFMAGVPTVQLLHFGLVGVGLSLSWVLVRRYNRLVAGLEEHVAERTRDLEAAKQGLERALGAAEESRRENERLAAAVGHAGDAIEITDADCRLVYVNPAHERTTGYDAAEVLGTRSALACRRPLAQELSPQGGWHGRVRTRRKDGSLRDLDVTVSPVRGAGEAVTHQVVVARDVTLRQRAEEALRRSESSFRALIEGSPDGIAVERGGHFIFVNRRFVAFLGHERAEDLVGKPLWDVVHADDRESVTRTDGPREARFVRRDGSTAVAEVVRLPLELDGVPAEVFIARDVGERNRLQAQLVLADRMASVGTLATAVAHEVNNPLSFVLNNAEFLGTELPKLEAELPPGRIDELKEVAEEIRLGANRIRNIIRSLMTFSRSADEARGEVDVRKSLDIALGLVDREIRHRARLVTAYAETPPVFANEGRLGQVFLNLLLNAAHAIPEGAADRHEIRVLTRSEGDRVVLEIRDTGSGIPADILPRVFDPFFTTKPVGQGTGLGLSICHSIVTSLGGTIHIDSRAGKGTTVQVSLPAAARRIREERVFSAPAAVRHGRARILVVDDEPTVARALVRVLREHDTVVAQSGREALGLLEHDRDFDVIFCDLMMPQLTGMDVYEWIQAQQPGLESRFVFLTGGAFTPRARAFMDEVPNIFLEKPFEASLVHQIVRERVAPAACA
jgi:PAS domain S-box-containing protein